MEFPHYRDRVKIAIVALGGEPALASFATGQQAGLARTLAPDNHVVLYRPATKTSQVQQRLAPSLYKVNMWTPSARSTRVAALSARLGAIVAGALAAVHLRLVEKPQLVAVLNPWNAMFIGVGSATRDGARKVSVAVDNLVRPQQKSSILVGFLGLALTGRARRGKGRFLLTCHSTAAAEAFKKRFGVMPIEVAAGINPPKRTTTRPATLPNDPVFAAPFDVLVGSGDTPLADAQGLRGHSRGAIGVPLIYLPAFDVRRVQCDELDDAMAKHGRLRIFTNSLDSELGGWLLQNARLVVVSDYDLLGSRLGASALTVTGELLPLDSPPNRELLGEASWLWAGEASLSSLLTDLPWKSKSRAKLRVQGLQPLADWRLVAQEFTGSFEG